MNNITTALHWRYATKKYDSSKKLTDEQLSDLLEAVRLAPSSYGLPVYHTIVVTNPEIRAKLKEAAYGQPQLTDASAIIVFAVKTTIDETLVDDYMKLVADTRGITVDTLAGFKGMLMGAMAGYNNEQKVMWASKQAYIGLGFLIESSALMEIDATPMEGFDPAKFDEILGLKEKGLKTVVIGAVGYRDASDDYIKLAKVRLPKDQFVIEVK